MGQRIVQEVIDGDVNAARQVPVEWSSSLQLASPGIAAHFKQEVTRGEGKANRKRRCCSTAFSLSHSLRSHSPAPSGTAPDRKWAGRGASPRGGGASWLHNLFGWKKKKGLTQECALVVVEGPAGHTASQAPAACRRRCCCCCCCCRRCGCVLVGEDCDLCNMRI